MYMRINQDCVGQLDRSDIPENVIGLMTSNVSTCLVMIVQGSRGILLIHDSGKLTSASIAEKIAEIGAVCQITLCFHPEDTYRHSPSPDVPGYQVIFGEHIEAIEACIGNLAGRVETLEIPAGIVFVNTAGHVHTENSEAVICDDPHMKDRQLKNTINSLFLVGDERMPVDVQYVEGRYTEPRYLKTLEDMRALVARRSKIRYFSQVSPSFAVPLFQAELIAKPSVRSIEFLNTEGTPDFAILAKTLGMQDATDSVENYGKALRTAAANNYCEGIRFLIEACSVDVDCQDARVRKTPLHHAVLREHREAQRLLLDYGAKTDIPDVEGKTVEAILKQQQETFLANERIRQEVNSRAAELRCLLKESPNEVTLLKELEACQNKIGAQVSYFVVDLKLTPKGQVVLLEFGPGMNSGLEGINTRYPDNNIQQRLTHGLNKLGLPFYINSMPGVPYVNNKGFLNGLLRGRNWPLRTREALFEMGNLSHYRGIYGGTETLEVDKDVLTLNSPLVDLLWDHKGLCAKHVFEPEAPYRPAHWIVTKKTPLKQIEAIQETLSKKSVSYVVLKTFGDCRGEGVSILKRESLVTEFQKLARGEGLAEVKMSFWMLEPHNEFLIEEYIASKPIQHHEQLYDPTMRVVFLIHRSQMEVGIDFLAFYWKLPQQALGHRGASLDERLKSSFPSDPGEIRRHSCDVQEKDQALVSRQLREILPKLFTRALDFDPDQYIEALNKQSKQVEALEFMQRLANSYGTGGQPRLGLHYADQVIQAIPRSHEGYHLKGRIYAAQEQYEVAIKWYTYALEKTPDNFPTYWRRAEAFLHQEKYREAEVDYSKSGKSPQQIQQSQALILCPEKYIDCLMGSGQAPAETKMDESTMPVFRQFLGDARRVESVETETLGNQS